MDELHWASIAELQGWLARGEVSSVDLVRHFLRRIEQMDRNGPRLRSVIEVNPDAEAVAQGLDAAWRNGTSRGPLHGIPILLKDNVDTADGVQTTAGSLALVGMAPRQDATVAARLRAAGAILLGKANMSEWANFRSTHSSSGWSARGGQCRNPHVLDRNPCGSSSGSGAAVAAGLAPAAIGTETDGSIVCPANANGIVGLKPTVGVVSRAGIVPISDSQDTAGPMVRSVRDAALLLGVMASTSPDARDPRTADHRGRVYADYTPFLDADGLKGARIGVARNLGFGRSEKVDAVMEDALRSLRNAGATLVDPAPIPGDLDAAAAAELDVLLFELRRDVEAYLQTRSDTALLREGFPPTLAGLIAFNRAHAAEEMPFFGQERFEQSEEHEVLKDEARYREALQRSQRASGPDGIDAVLQGHALDALVAPTGGPAWPIDPVNGDVSRVGSAGPSARAGYPIVTVPAGLVFGLPVGISFIGGAYSEPTLLRLAYAFEQATRALVQPRFLPTLALP